VLSTYGIPQIQRRVREFAESLGETISELGVIVSKYRVASSVHRNTVQRMEEDENLPVVFSSYVPEGNQIAQSAEFVDYGTLRQKYGYQGQFETFQALTKEFIDAAEEMA
jgi:chromosome partitioning protein